MSLYTGAGTWAWDPPRNAVPAWWEYGSPFDAAMAQRGIQIITESWPPWGTGLSGFGTTAAMRSWWHGAEVFAGRLRQVPFAHRNLMVHSHCGQVAALLACLPPEDQVPIRSLVTVCTPVRRDLFWAYAQVGCPWLHITERHFWRNRMQLWGAIWDKSLRVDWSMPAPAVTHIEKGIGHSDLVLKPETWDHVYDDVLMPFWESIPKAA